MVPDQWWPARSSCEVVIVQDAMELVLVAAIPMASGHSEGSMTWTLAPLLQLSVVAF
jgi:hypothetical protein